MFKILKALYGLLETAKKGEQPSLSITVAGLRVHLSHCTLHPQRGLEIGLAFSSDGEAKPIAVPSEITKRHQGNVLHLATKS